MIKRELNLPAEDAYPVEPWRLVETQFKPDRLAQFETLFALSNGYLGVRGVHDEGSPAHQRATLINGLHETWHIRYAESAFGFARTGQTIVSATDASIIGLLVDREPLHLPSANLLEYERSLDVREGVLERRIRWRTPAGKDVSVRSSRIVSLEHRHLMAIEYEVTVENADATVELMSEVGVPAETTEAGEGDERDDPRLSRRFAGRVLFPAGCEAVDRRIVLTHTTGRSRMALACVVDHELETPCEWSGGSMCDEDRGHCAFVVKAKRGKPVRLFKLAAYCASGAAPAQAMRQRAEAELDKARSGGMQALRISQRERLADFWSKGDLLVDGPGGDALDPRRIQQVVRLNLYHINQASARAEGCGIPAKGLTGRGYEGQYFWDTEIYVLPFLIYTQPRLARNLLEHRLSFLDAARARASQVNQKGALFPWRTINGEEASAYYAAGTAQYHINADIIYALRKYVEATGDETLLDGEGMEALVETARLWRDLGFFSDCHDGEFCIAGVTGPDEYNTVVNNNTYTNLMARENLWWAAERVERLREEDPGAHAKLAKRLRLGKDEASEWRRAADAMRLPYDKELGIHLQDDEFLEKKPWDFENTPPSHYPLLLRYHPLVIYRSKVIKQADVVLGMFLLSEEFSIEQKRRNYEFYDPLTTGDSSLSVSIQGIVAAEIGDLDAARDYLRLTSLMDFADVGRNAKDGCHIAAMGGTWMAFVHGLAGFRDHRGLFSFRPRLPREIDRLSFKIMLGESRLLIDISPKQVRYELIEGERTMFEHDGERIVLERVGATAERPLH